MVEVLWQCVHVAASYPLVVTASTSTTASTTSSTSRSSTSNVAFTTTATTTAATSGTTTAVLPHIEGFHPNQGPVSGGTIVTITGTGLRQGQGQGVGSTITACRFRSTTTTSRLSPTNTAAGAVVVPAVVGAEVGVVQCVTPAVDVDGKRPLRGFLSTLGFIMASFIYYLHFIRHTFLFFVNSPSLNKAFP